MKSKDVDLAQQAHDYLLDIGRLTVRLGEVERAPRHPDGSRENDVEHSFHLALSAAELAADYYPELDVGLVSQYSLVHDLAESYAGDVRTFGISEDELVKKEMAEAEATKRLLQELPPYTAQLLARYEKQIEPEARFVRFVDKLTPAIINTLAGSADTFKEDYGVTYIEELKAGHDEHTKKLQMMFPEFPFIHLVRELISKTSSEHLFQEKVVQNTQRQP